MTAKELMKKHNLEGAILEPAPYYWERVELAINEALGDWRAQAVLVIESKEFKKYLREELDKVIDDEGTLNIGAYKTWQERLKEEKEKHVKKI